MWAMPASVAARTPAAGDLAPADGDGARLRNAQPGDRLDELLLAVALDAGEGDDLPGAHRQRQPVDGGQFAVVAYVELLHLEQRVA